MTIQSFEPLITLLKYDCGYLFTDLMFMRSLGILEISIQDFFKGGPLLFDVDIFLLDDIFNIRAFGVK